MKDHILVRYGELALKKTNRKQFTNKIASSIRRALSIYPNLTFENRGMRFYVILHGTSEDGVIEVLKKIPGIYSFSVVSRCESTLDDIKALSLDLVKEELKDGLKTIKVDTHRAKECGMTSLEITKEISRNLFINIPNLKADVHNPELLVSLDVREEGTFIYTKTYMGLGGLPAGSLGRVALMISGGIDSVVAGYLAVKKGMSIEAVHFSSPPFTSDMAVQKVIDLLEVVCPYTEYQEIHLHVVPFTKIQQAIYDNCRDDYGITIMRRMMYRITEKLSQKLHCIAIVNGENVGQVASQTLESMATIEEVSSMPVIRPLAVFDKQDIINVSQKICAYDISIRPYEDCCTVFVPKHPQIKPLLNHAKQEESKFDFEELINEAVENTEKITLRSNSHHSYIDIADDIF